MKPAEIEELVVNIVQNIKNDEITDDQLFDLIETDIELLQQKDQSKESIAKYVSMLNQQIPKFGYIKVMRGIIQYLIDDTDELESKYYADLLHELIRIEFMENQFEAADSMLEEELDIRNKIEDNTGYVVALHTKAQFKHVEGDIKEAEKYYLKSWDLVDKTSDFPLQDRMVHSLANLYLHYLGEFEKAFEFYEKGLELARTHKDEMRQSFYLDHLGMVRYWQKQYDDALDYHSQSYKWLDQQDKKLINLMFNRIQTAMIYVKMGQYQKALEDLMKVSEFKRINTDTYSNVWYNLLIGEILHHQPELLKPYDLDLEELIGDLDHDTILKNTIAMADQANFAPGSVISRIYRSKYLFDHEPDTALTLLSEAKQIAINNNRFREVEVLKKTLNSLNIDFETI